MVELEPELPELKGVDENSPEYWEIVKKLLADEFTKNKRGIVSVYPIGEPKKI